MSKVIFNIWAVIVFSILLVCIASEWCNAATSNVLTEAQVVQIGTDILQNEPCTILDDVDAAKLKNSVGYDSPDFFEYLLADDKRESICQYDDGVSVNRRYDHIANGYWLKSIRYEIIEENGSTCKIRLNYKYRYPNIDAEISKVLDSLELDDLSTYDKLLRINKYVMDVVEYPEDEENASFYNIHNAYGALFDRCAVCEGYADLFYMMCRGAGIPCRIIVSEMGDNYEMHVYNIVKVDGKWYNVDTTWSDDEGIDKKYFLLGRDNFEDAVYHRPCDMFRGKDFTREFPVSQSDYVGIKNLKDSYTVSKGELLTIAPAAKGEVVAKTKNATIINKGSHFEFCAKKSGTYIIRFRVIQNGYTAVTKKVRVKVTGQGRSLQLNEKQTKEMARDISERKTGTKLYLHAKKKYNRVGSVDTSKIKYEYLPLFDDYSVSIFESADQINWSVIRKGGEYKYKVSANWNYITSREEEKFVDRRVRKIAKRVRGEKDVTSKIVKIQDLVDEFANYEEAVKSGKYKDTAYGALQGRECSMRGVSALLYRLFNEAGIPCRLIYGIDSIGNEIAWCLVKVDGKWYNYDIRNAEYLYGKSNRKFNKEHIAYSFYRTNGFLKGYPIAKDRSKKLVI